MNITDTAKAWWATKLLEGSRIFKSYSTYVVLAFSLAPDIWRSIPDDMKARIYVAFPQLQGWEAAIWAVSFAITFWKTRNAAQGIDIAKTED